MCRLAVQYSAPYFGYVKTNSTCFNNINIPIPEAVRIVEIISLGYREKKTTVYRSSYGKWVVDFDKLFK